MWTRGWWAGALVLVVALGSGCLASKETRDGADELRDRLGTPSWASAVTVETGLDGRFEDVVQVTVRLDGSASPADVSGFAEDLPGEAAKAGLDHPALAFVSATGARLDLEWSATVVDEEVTRGVTEWFGVAEALGPAAAATAATEGGASYVVTLPDGPVSAVHDTYGVLAPLAQPDTRWQVTATSGTVSLDLSGLVLPTDQQLATWDALTSSLAQLPPDLPASQLSLHFLDRIVADVGLTAPAETTDDGFTVAAYGPKVWPVVRPQLAAMARLRDPWTYLASWYPANADYDQNIFISLLSDQDPTDNGDETTRWSQAAQDYVQGL